MEKIVEYKKEFFEDIKRLRIELNKEESMEVNPEFPNRFYDTMAEEQLLNRLGSSIDLKTKELLDNGRIFCAEVDNKIVGYIACGLAKSTVAEDYIYINSLYIMPEYRKRGLGKFLFQKAELFAKEKNKDIMLDTYINGNAIKFYEAMGMKICWASLVKNK